MGPIHAYFESGVFRPTEQVDLPEHCEVVLTPAIVAQHSGAESRPGELRAILSRSYETGQCDLAARHDELQS
jgi:predicted DNA-binding antitoxin AbrB/MazE fold protein